MGDQLVARETGIVRAIVRPAIVESAVAYPFRGWNEGFTTSAPLVYLALKGQNMLPVSNKLILDVVPVDHVAAGMLMAAAAACVEQPKLVFQLSSGDLNPLRMDRVMTLTGLYKRKRFQDKETGNRFLNELVARMEFRPSPRTCSGGARPHNQQARRAGVRDARAAAAALGRGPLHRDRQSRQEGRRRGRARHDRGGTNIDMFNPFIFENQYVLRADNMRALRDRLPRTRRSCRGGRSASTGTTTG